MNSSGTNSAVAFGAGLGVGISVCCILLLLVVVLLLLSRRKNQKKKEATANNETELKSASTTISNSPNSQYQAIPSRNNEIPVSNQPQPTDPNYASLTGLNQSNLENRTSYASTNLSSNSMQGGNVYVGLNDIPKPTNVSSDYGVVPKFQKPGIYTLPTLKQLGSIKFEIPYSKLVFKQTLGSGQYGTVSLVEFEGTLLACKQWNENSPHAQSSSAAEELMKGYCERE